MDHSLFLVGATWGGGGSIPAVTEKEAGIMCTGPEPRTICQLNNHQM